jgi:repressor LexA
MNKFSDMLRFLRKQRGITQDKLAEDLCMSKSAVSMYENGKRLPSFEVLEAFADYFNVSLSVLNGEPESSSARIPVVGDVQAGIPTQAVADIVDWEEIPHSMACRGDYIGLKVRGASMMPRFVEGDTVIVRRQPDVESGEIAIVFVNGDEATMKKVIKGQDGITLVAFNTAVYEPHFYSNRQVAELPVSIYGKVVELRGKF